MGKGGGEGGGEAVGEAVDILDSHPGLHTPVILEEERTLRHTTQA